jgi:hypothetical protein
MQVFKTVAIRDGRRPLSLPASLIGSSELFSSFSDSLDPRNVRRSASSPDARITAESAGGTHNASAMRSENTLVARSCHRRHVRETGSYFRDWAVNSSTFPDGFRQSGGFGCLPVIYRQQEYGSTGQGRPGNVARHTKTDFPGNGPAGDTATRGSGLALTGFTAKSFPFADFP